MAMTGMTHKEFRLALARAENVYAWTNLSGDCYGIAQDGAYLRVVKKAALEWSQEADTPLAGDAEPRVIAEFRGDDLYIG